MPCEKWETCDRDAPGPFVPDLCVEVLLDRDRRDDVERRVAAYFEGGCSEVILVDAHGQVQFWGASGRRQASVFGIVLAFDPLYFEVAHAAAANPRNRDTRFGR
jgi:Uma2 family endonuclease